MFHVKHWKLKYPEAHNDTRYNVIVSRETISKANSRHTYNNYYYRRSRLFENAEAEQVDKNYPEKPLVSSAEQDAN